MKHIELKKDDIVVFKRYSDIYEKEDFETGSVIFVDDTRKTVCICWLEGYKSRVDDVPFEKVIATADKDGVEMRFWCISGKSVMLEQENKFESTLILGASNTGRTTLLLDFICFERLEYSKIVLDLSQKVTDIRDSRLIPSNTYIAKDLAELKEKVKLLDNIRLQDEKFILVIDNFTRLSKECGDYITSLLKEYSSNLSVYLNAVAPLHSCVLTDAVKGCIQNALPVEHCYILQADSTGTTPRKVSILDLSSNTEVRNIDLTSYAKFYL